MRILVCPLDWGLGHAARCIPLIRALLSAGHHVRVGAAGGGLELLRSEFPDLDVFAFPGYRVSYARRPWAFLPVLIGQAPRILMGLKQEGNRLRRILAEKPSDLVISDGRYGLKIPGIPCILITHQIAFRVPGRFPGRGWAEGLALRLNLAWLRRFDRVWIPDFDGPLSLAGSLSRPREPELNLEWIGPLSRFGTQADFVGVKVDIAAVISGPEPQRSLFESGLRAELGKLSGTRVLVRGLPGASGIRNGLDEIRAGELNVFDHLPGKALARLMADARLLVARSGYTTVMELAALGASAPILVPTPGQSEQEHLAAHLETKGACIRMEQDSLDLDAGRARVEGLPGFRAWRDPMHTDSRLDSILASHPLLRRSAAAAIPDGAQQ